MEKGNCNVVMGALCPPWTEPSKIPRCARRSSSTVRRSCTWQQQQHAWWRQAVILVQRRISIAFGVSVVAAMLRSVENLEGLARVAP